MVLNLYSCARGRSCLWCACSAFNHPSLDDISTGRGCLGVKREGRHACGGPSLSIGVLWRCPTLPQPIGCSTIGAAGLSFQVRNGGWAFPRCYDHHKCWCSTRSPTVLLLFGGGCGLIVVCIVVAASCCSLLFCYPNVGWVLFSVGQLVPVGSRAPCGASTSGLSTR